MEKNVLDEGSPASSGRGRYSESEKGEFLSLYDESDMSQEAFAKSFGLNVGTFRQWLYKSRRRSRDESDALGLAQVRVPGAACPECIVVKTAQGVEVRLPSTLESALLVTLLRSCLEPCSD